MISSLKIKLDCSWKFQRNWNVPLMSLERSWWAGFNGIYLVRFGFRMWEILIIKWFLLLKIQFIWKEKSVEDVVTLGATAQATLINIWCYIRWLISCVFAWWPESFDSQWKMLKFTSCLWFTDNCCRLCWSISNITPWSKYSIIESPNLCANVTQMVQVLVVYSKGVPEMVIHDCNLNSHNQPGLSPSQHHQTCIYSLSSHFHALFLYAHYDIFQSSIGMTNFWSSNTWN